MIEILSKHNSAKVYTDTLDKETKKQIAALLRMPAYADSKIRVMPDTHAGRGCVIGMTMTLCGRVSPSLVGVDMGCGMEVVTLAERDVDPVRLDEFIHAHIPAGKHVYDTPLISGEVCPLDDLRCRNALSPDMSRVRQSLGTLGGGNHFIELDRAPDGPLYLIIHSGSRSLGAAVANHYRDEAYRRACRKSRRENRRELDDSRDEEIGCVPAEPDFDTDRYDVTRFGVDLFGDTDRLTKAARRESQARLPVKWETAVCDGELYRDYLHDMALTIRFADENRRTIATRICQGLGLTAVDRFACVHNYIGADGILRKGAISARQGERVLIPLNMRDGTLLAGDLEIPTGTFQPPTGPVGHAVAAMPAMPTA